MAKTDQSLKEKEDEPSGNSLKGKTLLVVHTGLKHKEFIFPKLKKMGLRVIVLHQEKTPIAPWVDHWIMADVTQSQECINKISIFLKRNPKIKLGGVITFWEESTPLTAKIAKAFNLIGIPPRVTSTTRNKSKFRDFCQKHHIRTPKFVVLFSEDDFEKTTQKLQFPVVIKPIYGSSSAFVVKVDQPKKIKEVFHLIKDNIATHADAKEWCNLDLMAEEYIEGDEVDLDILIQNGRVKFCSIADNLQTNEPFFLETGYRLPSHLPLKAQRELESTAKSTLKKLGILNGCIHFEAKYSSHGPVPLEVNLRMGGDEVYPSIKKVWGLDLIENAIKISCGVNIKKIKYPLPPLCFVAGESITANRSGVLKKFMLPLKTMRQYQLDEVHFDKKVGDQVFAPPDKYEFMGWLTVRGKSLEQAENNLKNLLKNISYQIVPSKGKIN